MSSPPSFTGRGGRRAPHSIGSGRSAYWRSTNSVHNTRPILPLAPATATNSSWDMTRTPPPKPPAPPQTSASTNGPARPSEYLNQFFSSLKLDEMKESEGIFPRTDQIPPRPQGYGYPRGREPTFRPPPTLFQLEAQERMRPPVLGGRSHKDKLRSVAESWDDAPPTAGFEGEERILGMFEIPPDPPSRSGSPFRDETWLGPNQSVILPSLGDAGPPTAAVQAPPPWSTSALAPKFMDRPAPSQYIEKSLQVEETLLREAQAVLEVKPKDDASIVTRLGDEGMEESPRYSRRRVVAQARAEALKLARAGTTFETSHWSNHGGQSVHDSLLSGSHDRHEQDCPGFSLPISSQASFDSEEQDEAVVVLASPFNEQVSSSRGVRAPARPETPPQDVVLLSELAGPMAPYHPHEYPAAHSTSPASPADRVSGDRPPETQNLISPIRSVYLSTSQSRLNKMQKFEELRQQLG